MLLMGSVAALNRVGIKARSVCSYTVWAAY